MSQMLLSINPEHVENILSGKKRFEFRKVRCRNDISGIIIYATSPIMRVVAEVRVVDIIEDTPQVVWSKTSDYAGISKVFFNQYYKGRKKAVAYQLGEVNVYSEPRPLSELGVSHAPQSFVYV